MFKDAAGAEVRGLIRRLSGIDFVRTTFYLAGGTALALQLGHRTSNDLDLFTGKLFSTEPLREKLVHMGGLVLVEEEGTLHGILDGVKVSFLYYPYPVLHPFHEFEGLNVAAIGDIACMKAVAISQRGEKKDFFDMAGIRAPASRRDPRGESPLPGDARSR
jgi:predicted nucleotidyltransferase component of viral defense system